MRTIFLFLLLTAACAAQNVFAPLNGVNTWTGQQTFSGGVILNITGITQCLHANSSGLVSGTGSDCGGSGGGLTGSGTANSIAIWTGTSALGNSSITDDGTTVTTSELVQVNGSSTSVNFKVNGGVGEAINTPSTCSGTGGATVFTFLPCARGGFWGVINEPAGTTGYGAGVLGEITNVLTWTANPSFAAVAGNANPGGSGNINWVAGVVGTSLPDTTGTTANDSGVVGVGMASNAGATTLLAGLDGQIVTQVNVTTTTGTGLLVRSPSLTNGTVTNLSGILIQDQTGGGGLNPSPTSIKQLGNAPNLFTGHLNQGAAGDWAGTCTMSTTSCTITLAVAYTGTPGCVATVQGSTPIAAACGVSGTTVTITAASSNTSTWAAMLFGNPN